MEGFGEFVFGKLQALLGVLQFADVAGGDDQGAVVIQGDFLRRDQCRELAAIAAAEGALDIVRVAHK